MEAQLEKARKLGLPTGELERLLEEAKGLRKVKRERPRKQEKIVKKEKK